MEILQFISSLFSDDKIVKLFTPIIELLRQNSFDIKKALATIDPEMLKPIIQEFIKNINNRPAPCAERIDGLKPISNIADKDIIYTLNKHLSQS